MRRQRDSQSEFYGEFYSPIEAGHFIGKATFSAVSKVLVHYS